MNCVPNNKKILLSLEITTTFETIRMHVQLYFMAMTHLNFSWKGLSDVEFYEPSFFFLAFYMPFWKWMFLHVTSFFIVDKYFS
jgi:hypothetical protein